MTITRKEINDLNALESRVDHQSRTVDDLKTKSALSNQSLISMNEKIWKMGESLDRHYVEEKAYRDADLKWKSELFDKLDSKYSGKWAEKVLIWFWSAIWIAIIGALMTLILK